jgi:hypothetical protein
VSRLWHGTEVAPAVVAFQGLRVIDIDATLSVLGTSRADPRVADAVRRKESCLWVYLTTERDTARSYAVWGGNFAGLCRTAIGLPHPKLGWLYELDSAQIPGCPTRSDGDVRVRYVPPAAVVSTTCIDAAKERK